MCQGSIIKIFPNPFKIGRTKAGGDVYGEHPGQGQEVLWNFVSLSF